MFFALRSLLPDNRLSYPWLNSCIYGIIRLASLPDKIERAEVVCRRRDQCAKDVSRRDAHIWLLSAASFMCCEQPSMIVAFTDEHVVIFLFKSLHKQYLDMQFGTLSLCNQVFCQTGKQSFPQSFIQSVNYTRYDLFWSNFTRCEWWGSDVLPNGMLHLF